MYALRCQLLMRGILAANSLPVCTAVISTNQVRKNHYQALGIPPSSTQNEIKAAYYKLSMQFHPDKNQGSETAAQKFREITQAYEVLGNYRLRRLYDKGVTRSSTQHPTRSPNEPEEEDDAETKFYKSRFTKSSVGDEYGRTPIYDFDEWSRAHYGSTFQRRKDAKKKYERNEAKRHTDITSAQNEILLFSMTIVFMAIYAFFYVESSYDTPKARAVARAEAQAEEQKLKSD